MKRSTVAAVAASEPPGRLIGPRAAGRTRTDVRVRLTDAAANNKSTAVIAGGVVTTRKEKTPCRWRIKDRRTDVTNDATCPDYRLTRRCPFRRRHDVSRTNYISESIITRLRESANRGAPARISGDVAVRKLSRFRSASEPDKIRRVAFTLIAWL